MSKNVKQLRHFDSVEPTSLWSSIEARTPGPELPPPVRPFRRAMVIVSALAIFAVAGVFSWSAFRTDGGSPSTVVPTAAPPLTATLDAPVDGNIPGLTLAYGTERRDFFAQGGIGRA